MAKRPATRFGVGGELVPPGPSSGAQWRFLEAVRCCVPEAMQDLATIAPDLPDGYLFSGENWDREAPLREWCQRWGFTAAREPGGDRRDWLLTVARRTAEYLRTKEPTWPDCWVFPSSYRPPATAVNMSLRCLPDEETEKQFRSRVDAYVAKVKADARVAGWSDQPEKRSLQHFEMLAEYQVGGWTQAKIVEYYQNEDG